MRNICDDAGLLQKVREPTRNHYLLDLVLTDLSDTLQVLPAITDHKLVMCRLRIATPIYYAVTRYVWDYKQARWDGLIQAFANSDWQYLASGSVDTAVETFTRHVLNTSRAFIPSRRLRERLLPPAPQSPTPAQHPQGLGPGKLLATKSVEAPAAAGEHG